MPRAQWGSCLGGWAFADERGTHVPNIGVPHYNGVAHYIGVPHRVTFPHGGPREECSHAPLILLLVQVTV